MKASSQAPGASHDGAAWVGPKDAEAFIRALFGESKPATNPEGWVWMRGPDASTLGVPAGYWNLVRVNVQEWGPDAQVLYTPALCRERLPESDDELEVIGLVGLVARIPLGAHPRGPKSLEDLQRVLGAGHPPSLLVEAGQAVEIYWRFNHVWWLQEEESRRQAQALAAQVREMLQAWGERDGLYVDADVRLGQWCHLPGTRCGPGPDSWTRVRLAAQAAWPPESLGEWIRRWTPRPVGRPAAQSVVVSPGGSGFQLPLAPPFPVEVFPPQVADFVRTAARAIDGPVDYVAMGVLGAVSAAIGNARKLVVKPGFAQPPMLWLVAVGLPGTAKTPALTEAVAPLYAIEEHLKAAYEREKAAYDEALEQWEAMPRPERPPRPPAPTRRELVVSDATVEAVGGVLQRNPRGAILFRDELGAFLLDMGRYTKEKGGERQNYAQFWSGVPTKVNRVKLEEPFYVPTPFLAIVGGLQPGLLPELLRQEQRWLARATPGTIQDGFIDRFLFVYPQAKVPGWTEATVPEGLRRDFHRLIGLLFRLQPQTLQPRLQPVAVRLDDAARCRFADWMQANTAEANAMLEQGSPLAGPWAKLPQQLARLTLCLHELWRVARYVGKALPPDFAVTDDPVRGETVELAIRLIEQYFKPHLRRVYQELERGPLGEKVERILMLARKKGMTILNPRDIYSNEWAGIKTASEAHAVLQVLVDRGLGYYPDDSGRVQLHE